MLVLAHDGKPLLIARNVIHFTEVRPDVTKWQSLEVLNIRQQRGLIHGILGLLEGVNWSEQSKE